MSGRKLAQVSWLGRWYEDPAYVDLLRVALYRNLVDSVTRSVASPYLGKRLIRYCVIASASEANQKPQSQMHLPIKKKDIAIWHTPC